MYIFLLMTLLISTSSCQRLEDGWRGIQPLKTRKAQVEKILGKPEIDDNGYHGYRFDGGFIQVNYSTAPCEENQYKRGKYKIQSGTVLDYIVNLHEGVKLSELKFERGSYYKETSIHGGDLVYYIRRDNSIWITAFVQNGEEYAGRISFRAGNSDSEKHKCP